MNLLTNIQYNNLIEKYTERHRTYHNLGHITLLFDIATGHGLTLSIPQRLAIWYHDVIYYPQHGIDNEVRSAEFLRTEFNSECHIKNEYVDRACKIILDTKTHTSNNHESQVVLDLDLAGLGFSSDFYCEAGKRIRQEYNYLTDEVWIANRKIFLQNMLKRNHIFYTPWGRDTYEGQARNNMEAELNELSR